MKKIKPWEFSLHILFVIALVMGSVQAMQISSTEPFNSTAYEKLRQSIQPEKLAEALLQLQSDVYSKDDNSIVLLMGPTRAGKSTTIAYLLGCDMSEEDITEKSLIKDKYSEKEEVNLKEYEDVIVVKGNYPFELPQIGHGGESKTMFPKVFQNPSQKQVINYCDGEGFLVLKTIRRK